MDVRKEYVIPLGMRSLGAFLPQITLPVKVIRVVAVSDIFVEFVIFRGIGHKRLVIQQNIVSRLFDIFRA